MRLSYRVSIIVPVPAQDCRPAVLSSLREPCGLGPVEVLVAVGGCPSRQRNQAAEMASSRLLYFVDDDSTIRPDILDMMVNCLDGLGAAALGGPAVTHSGARLFESCVGQIMASPFGSGVVRARATPVGPLRRVEGEELVGCNLLITRAWFAQVGGLDEALYPGEDVDLLKRLRAQGAPLYYHPDARIERTRRRNLPQLAYQFFSYGRARGRGFYRNRRPLELLFLAPTVLLLYLLFLPWLPKWGFAAYLLLALVEAARIGSRLGSWAATPLCLLLFLTQHLSYGGGMALGLLGFPTRRHGEMKGIERHVMDL
jgi:GT2 family glycosyltransferase